MRPTASPGMKEFREATAVAAAAAAAAAAGPRIRPTRAPRPRLNPVFQHVLGAAAALEEHYQLEEAAGHQGAAELEEGYRLQEAAELEPHEEDGNEEAGWHEEDWDAHMGPEEEDPEPEPVEEDLMATLGREAVAIPPRR